MSASDDERDAQLEQQFQAVNHELTAAHDTIKRMKDSGKTDPGPTVDVRGPLGFPQEMWAEAGRRYAAKQQVKQDAHARGVQRKAERAARWDAMPPDQQAREQAKRDRRQAAADARAHAEHEAKRRDIHVRNCEFFVESLEEYVPDAEQFALLTDEQRARYAALPPKLMALAA